ncbi:MAG: glycosyltransferase [Chthonomonadales bacterium]
MRIALLAPVQPPCGVADYTRYLAAELDRLVDVVWLEHPDRFRPEMNSADVIHLQHQYSLFGGVAPWRNSFPRLVRSVAAPFVVTAHEIVDAAGSPVHRALISLTNRRTFHHPSINHIIVHTENDARRLKQWIRPGTSVTVLRHPVPPAPNLPCRPEARRALQLEGRFVVTIFGFLARNKGHRDALRALASTPQHVFLLLAGGRHPDDRSSYARNLERLIEDLDLRGRVHITGYLPPEGVAEVMAATDLVLAPFISGSGSGSVAMALACGRPVLASDIPANVEIAREMGEGMALFRAGDALDLAAHITELVHTPQRLQEMAFASQEYAARHTWAAAAKDIVAVYRSVLGGEVQ